MKKALFQDVPPNERAQYLRDNAYKVDPSYRYTRELEEGELQERKDQLSQNMIAIDKAEQVLKEAREAYNAVVKPLKEQNKASLQEIRTRSEEVCGEVYLMKDPVNERMTFYSPEGMQLFERSLLPEERQFSIVENNLRNAQ
jgi:flagellar hook-basal body complex protein FliE